MIDLHCHLLPGLDDGAADLEDAVQMARVAVRNGTRVIVCTPHCRDRCIGDAMFEKRFAAAADALTAEFARRSVPVQLCFGREVLLSDGRIPQAERVTLNGSVYLLVEFYTNETLSDMLERLQRLSSVGIVPVIAHPERYRAFADDPQAADACRRAGGLFQIDKDSITGHFGMESRRCAHRLLRRRLADFIAGDGHGPYRRTPCLREVHEIVSELYTIEYADFLLRENPLRCLRNERIYPY